MEKRMCYISLGVSILLLVLFLPDVIINVPFGKGISATVDIIVLICAVLLGYLSWNALKDLR